MGEGVITSSPIYYSESSSSSTVVLRPEPDRGFHARPGITAYQTVFRKFGLVAREWWLPDIPNWQGSLAEQILTTFGSENFSESTVARFETSWKRRDCQTAWIAGHSLITGINL